MLMVLVAALSTAVVDAADPAVGAWSDIAFSGVSGNGTTASTIVFTSGTPREILVSHDILIGNLQYKIDSGTYADCPSGTTFNVTTGQTVTFKYHCANETESATVSVSDNTLVAAIDSFGCAFTYTGA